MELLVFVCAAAMVLGGAVGVVVQPHPVHAALSLILTLFGIAVLFVAQDAQFLAAVQVIVYAGAIVVLFLFVIMLLGVDASEDLRVEPLRIQRPLAAVVGLGLVGVLSAAIIDARSTLPTRPAPSLPGDPHDENIRLLARDLFHDSVFAFELTSVLLVIAVVGTVLLARRPGRADVTELEVDGR